MAEGKKMSLTVKVLIGMALGIIVGLGINLTGLNAEGSWINTSIINGLFLIIGKMFVVALKMLVVPLVLFSLITGVIAISENWVKSGPRPLSSICSRRPLRSLWRSVSPRHLASAPVCI